MAPSKRKIGGRATGSVPERCGPSTPRTAPGRLRSRRACGGARGPGEAMTDNGKQRRSASYRLPVEDLDFLLRDEMRAIRFALEYAKAELALRDWGVRSTVVVFGSARIPPPERVDPADPAAALAPWYRRAREFSRIVSERGGALIGDRGPRENVIATGGGPGIMEAANRGAADAGAPSIGFNISLPREEKPNAFSTPELTFRFHYFAMRKMHFAMRANALVVFPGGFGTFDELFEILTLRQTGKAPMIPIVLFDENYWRSVINFEALVQADVIEPADLKLFRFADSAEDVWTCLTQEGMGAAHPPKAT